MWYLGLYHRILITMAWPQIAAEARIRKRNHKFSALAVTRISFGFVLALSAEATQHSRIFNLRSGVLY